MMEPMIAGPYQKRKDAMKKRLASLGKNNPVVMKAMKMQEPPEEDKKWRNWQTVDELVSAARKEYFDKENGSMGECLMHLSKALMALSKKPIDNSSSKVENEKVGDEDY